jgi:cell division protein FtsQ
VSTRAPAPPRRRAKTAVRRPPTRARRSPGRAQHPPIDPRIRARRVAVAREAGRRRLRRLLLVLALAAVTGAVAIVMWSPLLDVDRVAVAGAGARAASVRAAAGVEPGAALLLVRTGGVEERVEELPWVAEARATRELPGTLRITVTERPPVGFATRPDGTAAIVDATGVVTEVAASAPAGLPGLVTAAPPPRPGKVVTPGASARVAAALGPLAGRVTRVSVDRGEAALTLTDARVVRLGDLTRLDEKARAAAAVLDAPGLPAVAYVDVRVPSAPVTG